MCGRYRFPVRFVKYYIVFPHVLYYTGQPRSSFPLQVVRSLHLKLYCSPCSSTRGWSNPSVETLDLWGRKSLSQISTPWSASHSYPLIPYNHIVATFFHFSSLIGVDTVISPSRDHIILASWPVAPLDCFRVTLLVYIATSEFVGSIFFIPP